MDFYAFTKLKGGGGEIRERMYNCITQSMYKVVGLDKLPVCKVETLISENQRESSRCDIAQYIAVDAVVANRVRILTFYKILHSTITVISEEKKSLKWNFL